MNLDELDQGDDDDIRPMQEPRFSVPLEDLDNTYQSVEYARRAVSEQPLGGRQSFGRQSFGIRLSDPFADLRALQEDDSEGEEVGGESAVFEAVGEESMGRLDADLGDEGSEMGYVRDEEEDVTMGGEGGEIDYDEGESYYLPGLEDAAGGQEGFDVEGDDVGGQTMGLNGDYDDVGADSDSDIEALSHNALANPPSLKPHPKPTAAKKRKAKPLPVSRHGIPYPHFPRTTIKKMAQTFSGGAMISNEALNAIVAASEAFFEQVSDDLAVYAGHGGRKTIEDVDVVQLLKRYVIFTLGCSGVRLISVGYRQRQITPSNTAFSLAQRYLPRELLQEVKMPLVKVKKGKKRELEVVDEEE